MPTRRCDGDGAEGAAEMDAAFRKIIANDRDIQAVIKRVWGTGPRPSDTPKNLEQANKQASAEIEQILKAKGVELPDRTFINPRSGTIEGHRGWSGMSGWQRAAVIAAAAATGVGAGMALGGGASVAGLTTPGVTSGFGGAAIPGTVVGVGGTTAATAIPTATALTTGGSALSKIGAAMKSKDALETGARALGAYGQSEANNRGQAETGQLNRDVIGERANSNYETALQNRRELELKQRADARTGQSDSYMKSLRSAMALNWKPTARPDGVANVNFVGQGIGAQGRAAAEELQRQAMLKLLAGEKFDDMPDVERFTPAAAPRTSRGESFSKYLAPALAIASSYRK